MAARTYEVTETLRGFAVVEYNANGARFHAKTFHTRDEADARVIALQGIAARTTAVADVRKRAKFRCECTGACGLHTRRCTALHDTPLAGVIGVTCQLRVVALDHNLDNLVLTNLASLCQLCLQRHEADERGSDALFEMGGER